MVQTFGYSGKPLISKLGLKSGWRLSALDAPAHYPSLVQPLPGGAVLAMTPFDEAQAGAELVHAFFDARASLEARAVRLIDLPAAGGMIWVSWPKKSSPLFCGLTDEHFRQVLLPTGWVDVKVAAVDADWSGLKFLRRRA